MAQITIERGEGIRRQPEDGHQRQEAVVLLGREDVVRDRRLDPSAEGCELRLVSFVLRDPRLIGSDRISGTTTATSPAGRTCAGTRGLYRQGGNTMSRAMRPAITRTQAPQSNADLSPVGGKNPSQMV